jgi:hypothetical protein
MAEIRTNLDPETMRQESERMAQHTRGMLAKFAERAAQILEELAEHSDNDRVRLSAVNSILDRAGVVAPTQIQVAPSSEQHALLRAEAEETIARLQRNMKQAAIPPGQRSIEAIIVHEGVDEEEDSLT